MTSRHMSTSVWLYLDTASSEIAVSTIHHYSI